MAANVYEGMFILDSTKYGREPEAVSSQISKMIEAAGGEVLVSRLWEERRLAYPIQGQRKGTYWLSYFRVEGTEVAGLERQCQLSDSILRVLFLKVDPRIVDTLVEHAKAGPKRPEPETDNLKNSDDDDEFDSDTVSEEAIAD
ncbi:MAG: 30S ribosomal protein S6 [Planctomycetia bacterium]